MHGSIFSNRAPQTSTWLFFLLPPNHPSQQDTHLVLQHLQLSAQSHTALPTSLELCSISSLRISAHFSLKLNLVAPLRREGGISSLLQLWGRSPDGLKSLTTSKSAVARLEASTGSYWHSWTQPRNHDTSLPTQLLSSRFHWFYLLWRWIIWRGDTEAAIK